MARSRRRTQKFRVKVSRRPKRAPFLRTKLPAEIRAGKPTVETKLGKRLKWDTNSQLEDNYVANSFLADPNIGFGRNSGGGREQMELDKEVDDSDDDLRQLEGKPRRDGKRAEVPKPTTQQCRTIKGLLEVHGDDIEAMVKDRKRNPMLLPASKLRRIIAGYQQYGERGRCSFRTPYKHL